MVERDVGKIDDVKVELCEILVDNCSCACAVVFFSIPSNIPRIRAMKSVKGLFASSSSTNSRSNGAVAIGELVQVFGMPGGAAGLEPVSKLGDKLYCSGIRFMAYLSLKLIVSAFAETAVAVDAPVEGDVNTSNPIELGASFGFGGVPSASS